MRLRGPFDNWIDTEDDFTAHAADRGAHRGAAGAADIAAGVLTLTGAYDWVVIDTEGDAASDDLVSISGLSVGDVVELTPESDARTITVKHGTALKLAGELDFTMNNQYDCIRLRCVSAGVCREISRMNGGA